MSDNQAHIQRCQLIELNDELAYFKQRNLNLRSALESMQELKNTLEARLLELEKPEGVEDPPADS